MTLAEEASRPAAGLEVAQRWLPALLLLFVGSGCAALIYEVVWFQLLQLSIGSSAVSLGVLLGIFMGGMCLGSLVTPRFLDANRHPLRVYAMLELGIGVCGLLVMWLVPRARRRLHRVGGHRSDQPGAARGRGRHLPDSADPPDGRHAAGDRALGRDDAARRLVARLLLRRQPGGRGDREPPGRLLPAARLRHADHHLHGRGASTWSWRRWRSSSRSGRRIARPRPAERRPRRPLAISSEAQAGLRDDRALRADGPRRRSGVDAALVAALRRHRLHLLDDPRRVPDRAGHRQQPRVGAGPRRRQSADGAGLVPGGASAPRWPGRPTPPARRCRSGRSTRRSPPACPSRSSWI